MAVRDLETDDRLARDHVDDAHADHRKAARDVLVEARYLAALDAGRRLHLEARDDRARVRADHVRLDAEVLQLELDLARQRFQRLLGIPLDLRLRLVEQRQRRQFALARGAGEQRNLRLAFRAVALLDRRDDRFDPDRLALGLPDRVDLAHDLAFGARLARGIPVLGLAQPAGEAGAGAEQEAPDRVHQPEPRQAGRERDRNQQQREQEQAGAERPERAQQAVADELAEDAAFARGQAGRSQPVQPGESRRRDEERDEAEQAQGRLERRALLDQRPAQDHAADQQQQQRQRIGDDAEQVEREIGDPCAERAAEVLDAVLRIAGVRPARVGWHIAGEAGKQVDRERQQQQEARLAQALVPVLVQPGSRSCRFQDARHQDNLPEIPPANHCRIRISGQDGRSCRLPR